MAACRMTMCCVVLSVLSVNVIVMTTDDHCATAVLSSLSGRRLSTGGARVISATRSSDELTFVAKVNRGQECDAWMQTLATEANFILKLEQRTPNCDVVDITSAALHLWDEGVIFGSGTLKDVDGGSAGNVTVRVEVSGLQCSNWLQRHPHLDYAPIPDQRLLTSDTMPEGAAVYNIACALRASPTPLLQVSWLKDGMPLDTSDRVKYSGRSPLRPSLIIGSPTRADSGIYQCRARNDVGWGPVSRPFSLVVGDDTTSRPVCGEERDVVTRLTDEVELVCVTDPRLSDLEFTWRFRAEILSATEQSGTRSVLRLVPRSLGQDGEYACEVRHPSWTESLICRNTLRLLPPAILRSTLPPGGGLPRPGSSPRPPGGGSPQPGSGPRPPGGGLPRPGSGPRPPGGGAGRPNRADG
ncbi:PREDICTED: hemicentin-2-like [Priapulus caudatus]|uniref:Hemicentin-2-like n=1 Tax=Priapulus caudatus TaxID=37621 RepID=A0ABM1ESJ6_PRICU|nr:PREDICTED: hemicentin-2-like [Priapulus caudatus]